MIENDEQLKQTRLALNHLESALSALKRDVLPLNPTRFALMAEPVVDHIRELRGYIEEFVGVRSAVQEIEVLHRIADEDAQVGE